MPENPPPRPPSVSFFCLLLAAFSLWNLASGLFQMNNALYASKGGDVLLGLFAAPVLSLVCALGMLQGRNPARLLFWSVFIPFSIWLVWHYSSLETPVPMLPMILRLILCALGLLFTLLPAANAFFAGRDYHELRRSRAPRRRRPRASGPSGQSPTDYHY